MDGLLVTSIDFGTTYSGWAYSFNHEYDRDPLDIHARIYHGEGQLASQKAPTAVLIKPDGRTLHKFGYEAEKAYANLALEEEHESYYYFKRFKMLLDNQSINRKFLIEDKTGKKLPAQLVFSLAIKYLKDDVLRVINDKITGGVAVGEIMWAITVPAIWNDAAKQFMREAAVKAGIPDKMITVALEPEAASLYCRKLPVEKCGSTSLSSFRSGTKYMVVDAGGGTVDITVHEVRPRDKVRELYQASGGPWGGTKVDDAFEQFIDAISGRGVMHIFQERHMDDYLDLMHYFEFKKREITSEAKKFVVRLTLSLTKIAEKVTGEPLQATIERSRYNGLVKCTGDKIIIDHSVAVQFFENPISRIIEHVRKLFRHQALHGCGTVLLVGGFSDSNILQESMKQAFPNIAFIFPQDAGLAVLKGAVIFGHQPNTITERKCKYTYGHDTTHLYSLECRHKTGRRERDDNGDLRCYDMFLIHARIGQTVKVDEKQPEQIVQPITDEQTSIGLDLYACSLPEPELVTEIGCTKIGSLRVPIYNTHLGRDNEFGVSYLFGGTEIEVHVVDKSTGISKKTAVNFLS